MTPTTAEDDDDDDDDDDSSDQSVEESSSHVPASSVPLTTQLDQLIEAEQRTVVSTARSTRDNQAPIAASTTPTTTPIASTSPPPPPPTLSNQEFIAMMTRSTARPLPGRSLEGIEILPERFEQFQSDDAQEFQSGNKPPWAPTLKARPLNNARRWKTLEIYDNFDLAQLDWYKFLVLVCGYTDNNDVSEFARTETYGERTGLIAPTRVGDRPGLIGTFGGAVTASGAGFIDPSAAGMMSPDVRLPTAAPSRDGAPSGLFGGGGGGVSASAGGRGTSYARGDGGRVGRSPLGQTSTTANDQLNRPGTPYGFPSEEFGTMMSSARLSDERQELGKKLHSADLLDLDSAADREERRRERLDMVRALPIINRPLATGVFFMNPVYIAAVNSAYAKVQIYAAPGTSLRNVPSSEFMRDRSTRETGGDMASYVVRATFAELVACMIFLTHDSRHRGNQFKSDRQANEDRSNELLRTLRTRFGYSRERRVFFDLGLPVLEQSRALEPPTIQHCSTHYLPSFGAIHGGPLLLGPAKYRPFSE